MSRTILIVDDEPGFRAMVRGALKLAGYHVREAVTGEEALDFLEAERPDALLLDIRLPGIDGWEVLERLKEKRGGLPVILLSANDSAASFERAQANDCLTMQKPFSVRELIATLGRLLDQQ